VANKISRARSASTICGLWKTYKCLFIQNCTRVITWLLVNNALKNILEVFLDIVSLDRLHSAWYSKYLQNFQKCLQKFCQSLKVFSKFQVNFRNPWKGSGPGCSNVQKWLARWYSLLFKRVQVIFGSTQIMSNYLWLSSEGFGWTLTTLKIPWITVGCHIRCLHINLRYICSNLHCCYKFAQAYVSNLHLCY